MVGPYGKVGTKPLEFVDSISPESHCALFYESSDYARKIEFRFIEVGLARGEHCFYLTHTDEETDSIRNQMSQIEALRDGIDCGLLKIGRDSFLPKDRGEVSILFEERRKSWMHESFRPLRFVGRTLPEIDTTNQVAVQIEGDVIAQQTIGGSAMTLLCSYPVDKVREDVRNDWFLKMFANHHAAIFAPKYSEGIAFYMR